MLGVGGAAMDGKAGVDFEERNHEVGVTVTARPRPYDYDASEN